MDALLVALLASGAVAAALPPSPAVRPPTVPRPRAAAAEVGDDWLTRWRGVWSALAGVAVACFVSGVVGLVLGVGAAVTTWVVIARAEPPARRRRREAAEREVPGVVHLLASALSSGAATGQAVRLVCEALPGAASELLSEVPVRLSLGADPEDAWAPALAVSSLAPLARTMIRAHRSGSPVADAVQRLSDELEQTHRLRGEERARSVGVKAAVPLGLCLLPSFLLLGIIPLVVGLLQSLNL